MDSLKESEYFASFDNFIDENASKDERSESKTGTVRIHCQ